MKQTFLCAICIASAPVLDAQNASNPLVNDLVQHWQTSKSLSLAVAQAMPADNYRPFSATDRAWNFADQMGTLALKIVLSCSLASHTKVPARFQSAFDHPMDHSKPATLESLSVAYDFCIEGLKRMNDADLLDPAVGDGHREMKFDILWNASAHATHALGQAEMYLRTKGIKPPDTGPKYEF